MQTIKLPFANTTITLYNKYTGTDQFGKTFTTWFRSVHHNCTLGKSDTVMTVGSAVLSSDDYVVQIPQDTDFLEHWEWVRLSSEVMATKFTANKGDIVVKGEVNIEIPYNGNAKTVLQKDYGNRMFEVRLVQNNTGAGIPLGHYALGGK